MKVREVMTKDPITIDPTAPIGTAISTMRKKQVRHLPVVDDEGVLLGIVTDRDLRQAALTPGLAEYFGLQSQRRLRSMGQALEDLRVRDAMTWGVATTQPEATLAQAALVMFEQRVGCLPVVDAGRLVGILTERDLLGALAGLPGFGHVDPEGFLWERRDS